MKTAISNIAWNMDNDHLIYDLMKKYGYQGLEIAPSRIIPPPASPYDNLDYITEWKEALERERGFSIPSMQSIWYGRSEKRGTSSSGCDEVQPVKNRDGDWE